MKLKQCNTWGTDNLPLTLASRAVHHLELFNDQQHWKSLCQPRSTHGYLCLEILRLLLAYYIIMIILLKLPIDSYFLVVSVLLLSVSLLSIDCIILIFLKSVYDYFSNFPLIFRLPVLQFFPVSELARESPDDFHLMKYNLSFCRFPKCGLAHVIPNIVITPAHVG